MQDSSHSLNIDINNYSGPLDVLLDLARSQKVNLENISITELADQFINFINNAKEINLDLATEYLLMATWLAYLKSKLLLPETDEEDFKASQVAERLKLQLKKLELIRILSDQLLKKKRIGIDIHFRGQPEGIRLINSPEYKVSLFEILKSYSNHKMQKDFLQIKIQKLPVFTTDDGIQLIKKIINQLSNWKNIKELVPLNFRKNSKLKKSGLAGIFSASLELAREGKLDINQKKLFDDVLIKGKVQ